VALTLIAAACTVPPPAQPPRVILYGDSLSVESFEYFAARIGAGGQATALNRSFGGAGICDFFDEMFTDAANVRPTAVVLAFVGNNETACVRNRGGAVIDRYRDDAGTAIELYKPRGVRVYLAATPKVASNVGTPELPDPFREMYFGVAAARGVEFIDAGHALLSPVTGEYEMRMPCFADEQGRGCFDDTIQVRDPFDGLHFCPTGARPLPCSGYVGGARRFGEAMANRVAGQLGL
jgi:hypothetical protein